MNKLMPGPEPNPRNKYRCPKEGCDFYCRLKTTFLDHLRIKHYDYDKRKGKSKRT